MIDFRIESLGLPEVYKRVVPIWGREPGFGVLAPCPECGRFVLFRDKDKQAIEDPAACAYPALPENWHETAEILSES